MAFAFKYIIRYHIRVFLLTHIIIQRNIKETKDCEIVVLKYYLLSFKNTVFINAKIKPFDKKKVNGFKYSLILFIECTEINRIWIWKTSKYFENGKKCEKTDINSQDFIESRDTNWAYLNNI